MPDTLSSLSASIAASAPPDLSVLQRMLGARIMTDRFSRGRYATDASIYQMVPHGVVVPESLDDVRAALDFARSEGLAILPRGGGTSQCGQTVNHALVIDNTKHLNRILSLDVTAQRCVVEPGIVLDELNRQLKPHGLWFPVDVSTSSRATIGGMAGNNSCGGRSIRYGIMRDNVVAIDAIMSDGTDSRFAQLDGGNLNGMLASLWPELDALGREHKDEILSKFPQILRRVGGYNIDSLIPDAMAMRPGGKANDGVNLSHLLVGSEGTLAYSHAIELKLWPLPAQKIMGICHFPTFYKAMDAAQHLVTLDPVAVELIDDTMLELARSIPLFKPIVEEVVKGAPAALLVVEFAEEDEAENLRRLARLHEMMSDLGFGWNKGSDWTGGVIEAIDPGLQGRVSEMRKSGLNIMMSMKQAAKPVSFVEDCAVDLKHLADYTAGLTAIFDKYGTRGTWYAHASVGCLHVRPVLNMKLGADVEKMRAIAEDAFALVRQYGGSHSGEHGDGIVRSEFNEVMFGPKMAELFRKIKILFDPRGLFNPGKIIDAPNMDARELFRFSPGYSVNDFPTQLDWSAWPGSAGGMQGAVEMCNNNGACRKLDGGVMCPSFRATGDEKDSTRGRANTLRLALSGQLGSEAMASDQMADTMKLCVSCKACKRECPTGVDMSRMKVEVTALRAEKQGLSMHDQLVAHLPAYAPFASRFSRLINSLQAARRHIPVLSSVLEVATGFTARRDLPKWSARSFLDEEAGVENTPDARQPVILFADTFNRYFEPQNLRSALRVLNAAGYQVFIPKTQDRKPVCCGRTYLSTGLVEKARQTAENLVSTYLPFAEREIPIVGLEPSCTLALRDEVPALLASAAANRVAQNVLTFEELLIRDKPDLQLRKTGGKALLHGHCHQKAFDVVRPIETVLRELAGFDVEQIETSCCGMAGAFGYGTDTYDISMKMGSAQLFPKVKDADVDVVVIADGTSCRCQISDGTGRLAQHVAAVLADRL